MPASILTRTPSGVDAGVSTSSKRRSSGACSRQALWVAMSVAPRFTSSRTTLRKRRSGSHSHPLYIWGEVSGEAGAASPRSNHGLWSWVPAFAGTTRGESFAFVNRIVAVDLFRQFDHHASGRHVDGRNHGVGERQHDGGAGRRRDLDDVAGAKIMDRNHLAKRFARRGHRGEADQIGVVIFVLLGLR